jgi:heme exporter protein A
LASPAKLWLLDEPTTALDKAAIASLEGLIAEHRAAGGMAIISTHSEIVADNARTLDLTPYALQADQYSSSSIEAA